ncbi:MAG TPA: TadE/TadG family type IV pilus assembly protein [Abditibacterium sp.]
MVEFAFVVPILLALLMAILEAATLGRAQMVAANAAREGARTVSVGKPIADARTRMKAVGQSLGLLDSEITFFYSSDNGATFPTAVTDSSGRNTAPANSLIRVQVNHPHRALTGFYPFLRNYRNQAQVTMRRESN